MQYNPPKTREVIEIERSLPQLQEIEKEIDKLKSSYNGKKSKFYDYCVENLHRYSRFDIFTVLRYRDEVRKGTYALTAPECARQIKWLLKYYGGDEKVAIEMHHWLVARRIAGRVANR